MRTTWILIADGGRASLYRRFEAGKELKLIEEFDCSDGRKQANEINTDAHGTRLGGALESQNDPQTVAQERFAKELAEMLNHRSRDADEIALAAPPAFLGRLRPHIRKDTSAKIVIELAKDYTGVRPHDLIPVFDAEFEALNSTRVLASRN